MAGVRPYSRTARMMHSPTPIGGGVDPRHLLATVATMADEGVGDWGRPIADTKCSVCGAQATGLREDRALDFDGRPMVEFSFRCEAHKKNTGWAIPGRTV